MEIILAFSPKMRASKSKTRLKYRVDICWGTGWGMLTIIKVEADMRKMKTCKPYLGTILADKCGYKEHTISQKILTNKQNLTFPQNLNPYKLHFQKLL